jgi:DNA modification methylase
MASETINHYVGIDPRTQNHPIYKNQVEFYQKHTSFFENPTKVDLHESPAEDFDYSDYQDYFDLVFTSPPYFNVERYSNDDTQSWIRYESIQSWNKDFLHKTLEKVIPTVKKGGKIAINIADVYTSEKGGGGKNWKEITQPMCKFIESKGLTYKGCIGMELAKRPNSGGAGTVKQTEHNQNQYKQETLKNSEENQDKRFCEPIWIFEK